MVSQHSWSKEEHMNTTQMNEFKILTFNERRSLTVKEKQQYLTDKKSFKRQNEIDATHAKSSLRFTFELIAVPSLMILLFLGSISLGLTFLPLIGFVFAFFFGVAAIFGPFMDINNRFFNTPSWSK